MSESAKSSAAEAWRSASRAAAVLLGLALAVLAGPAEAAPAPQPIALSPEDQALVGNIEDYLNGITTVEASFVQVTADGAFARGKFYLSRPGRMRFEYDPPAPYLLVSDGTWFIYIDRELEQATYLPLKKTPADLLLRENLKFNDGLVITGFERKTSTLRIEVTDQRDPDLGQVSLTFVRQPLTLKSWTVKDAQGQRIQVTLVNPLYGGALDAALFRYVNTTPKRQD